MEIILLIAKIISGIFILATVFTMLATMAGSEKAARVTKAVNTIPRNSRAYAIALIAAFAIVVIIP